ncbi:MAG: FAD-binding protein, partial [Hyphomicrobiaceae bacterium]|nr:FAD-binding protein [Hyphomicrobiaceae bacterium]
MTSDLFTRDFKAAPYWWDTREAAVLPSADLPEKADVVIVGSGYTGLCAALETAAAGRSTVVLDAEDALERLVLLVAGDAQAVLLDALHGLRGVLDAHVHRVAQVLLGHAPDGRRHRGGEQHGL